MKQAQSCQTWSKQTKVTLVKLEDKYVVDFVIPLGKWLGKS